MNEIDMLKEQFMSIPEELRKIPHWVLWTMEEREGKRTKIPKNPRTGGNAMSSNAATWGTFEQALNVYVHNLDRFSGIGWMFKKGSGYFGVDLDHCIDREDFCREFVNTLQSYNEISTSGTGIHIICKGSLPEGGRRSGTVEMYETGRYFVFTGNPYDFGYSEIRDCTEEIKTLHKKYISGSDGSEQNSVSGCGENQRGEYWQRIGRQYNSRDCVPVSLDDERLLKKIRSSGKAADFEVLYSGGWEKLSKYESVDKEGKIYADHSKADLTLCGMLAFWTGRDAGRMDALFRSSGLMRRKWDERRGSQTYGERTIQTAIDGCAEIYKPDERLDVLDWDSVIGD